MHRHHCHCNTWMGGSCTCPGRPVPPLSEKNNTVIVLRPCLLSGIRIPLITEYKYLKGTPEVCLDCNMFGLSYENSPIPGYNYCEICIVGKILNIRKLSWWEKFIGKPINYECKDLRNFLAKPVESPNVNYSTYDYCLDGIKIWVTKNYATQTVNCKLKSECQYGKQVEIYFEDMRRYNSIGDVPEIKNAIEELRNQDHEERMKTIDYDRICTIGGSIVYVRGNRK